MSMEFNPSSTANKLQATTAIPGKSANSSANKTAAKINDSGIFATFLRILSYIFCCFCCRSDDAEPEKLEPSRITPPTEDASKTKTVMGKALPDTQDGSNKPAVADQPAEKVKKKHSSRKTHRNKTANAGGLPPKTEKLTPSLHVDTAPRPLATATTQSAPVISTTQTPAGAGSSRPASAPAEAPVDPFSALQQSKPGLASVASNRTVRDLGNVVNGLLQTKGTTTETRTNVLDLDAVKAWVAKKGFDYDQVKDPEQAPHEIQHFTGWIGKVWHVDESVWQVPYLTTSELGPRTRKAAFLILSKELVTLSQTKGQTTFDSGKVLQNQRTKMGLRSTE
jgi:hypothetical protein